MLKFIRKVFAMGRYHLFLITLVTLDKLSRGVTSSLPFSHFKKKNTKKCPFPKVLIVFFYEKGFLHKIKVLRNLEDSIFEYFIAGHSVLILQVQVVSHKKNYPPH